MNSDHRLLLVIGINLLLAALVSQVNTAFSGWAVHFTVDALFLLVPGLYLGMVRGLLAAAVAGLAMDALLPLPFGAATAFYLAAFALILRSRRRLRRENWKHLVMAALALNFTYMTYLSFFFGGLPDWSSIYWSRLITDLILSEFVVFACACWYVGFQLNLLHQLGANLGAELRDF